MYKLSLFFAFFVFFMASCKEKDTEKVTNLPISYEKPYVHALLGNPSDAVADLGEPENYLLVRDQFIAGYNNSSGSSGWVAWHLSPDWIGNIPRQDDFRPDNLLPQLFTKISSGDYTGSGFDRGHVCPSADRTKTQPDNSSTFNMTNILPMAPVLDQNMWVDLEIWSRDKVKFSNMEAYIISGGYGQGGVGNNGNVASTIANGKVVVPSHLYKIVVLLPLGETDLERISAQTRIIAVAMPNTNAVGLNNWGNYRVSINALETATGFDFLSNLSESLQNEIESQVDNGPI